MAAVMAESGGYYVLVTACAGRARAEELVERLRQAGEPAEIGDI
jgi:cell division septation protein DedD